MPIQAVVFDYGMVLTGMPDAQAHAEMLRITGLPLERFEELYWADRHAYDEGKLNGITFWQKIVRDAGLALDQTQVEELNRCDARMWTTENPAMIAWHHRLKQRGLKTAILSNMGDAVHESIARAFPWISDFDVLVWSYQLGIAKPDPEIYHHVLRQLGTAPQDTLFIDDKKVNVEAAAALGMRGFEFTTAPRLRTALISAGLEAELPLP